MLKEKGLSILKERPLNVERTMDLGAYMAESIRNIMAKAYLNVLGNAVRDGLRAALASPLFHKIRAARALGWEHTGGCTLYEHRDEVEAMIHNA